VLAHDAGDWTASERSIDELSRQEAELMPEQRAYLMQLRAFLRQALGDVDGAIACHERTLELAREIEDAWLVRMASNNLGYARLVQGRRDEARLLFLHVVEHEPERDRWLTAVAHANLAYVAATEGDAARAREAVVSALGLMAELGVRHLLLGVHALVVAAWVSAEAGDRETAARLVDVLHRYRFEAAAWDDLTRLLWGRLLAAVPAAGPVAVADGSEIELHTALAWARDRLVTCGPVTTHAGPERPTRVAAAG
jgi:tetratricopeptide (TPR) repeat protein